MKRILSVFLLCSLLFMSIPQVANAYSTKVSLPLYKQGSFTSSSDLTSEGKYKDTYIFSGTAGQTIQVSLDSNDFDSYIIILDSLAKRVATDDDSGTGTNSYLEYTLPYTGEYSIVASQYSIRTGSYTISASYSNSGSSGDSGDDWNDAETININDRNTYIYSSLDHEWDEDFYFFQAPVSGRYTIETIYGETDVDTFGELRNEDYSRIESDDDDGIGNNFEISRYLDAGSWYYIIVAGSDGDEIGNYKLCIDTPISVLNVPHFSGSSERKMVQTVFERGFEPTIHGFYSPNNINYSFPDGSSQGVCFGMTSIAALNYADKLPKIGPDLGSGFGYNISGISAFDSGNLLYPMTSNSTYNIGELPQYFKPSVITIDSSQAKRIGQAVGWFQNYNNKIKYYSEGSVISKVKNWTLGGVLETANDITYKIDNSRPFLVLAHGDGANELNHSMVPISLYKVVNENKYLLGVYDPNFPGQTSYIEIMVDNNGIITDYDVIRHSNGKASNTSCLHFVDLTSFVDDVM